MDTLTPAQRSERMSRVRGRDTKPEIAVRRIVHGLGYRYRLHGSDLPGKPDIVLPRHRAVIFVHGCFWHRHGDPHCKLARMPKSRLEFWGPKLDANQARDAQKHEILRGLGLRILVIWECEVKNREAIEAKVLGFLEVDGRRN
jgi:DNA mismatch endonuclease (patch repair protein)